MSKSYILSRMDWAKAYRDYEVLKVGNENLLTVTEGLKKIDENNLSVGKIPKIGTYYLSFDYDIRIDGSGSQRFLICSTEGITRLDYIDAKKGRVGGILNIDKESLLDGNLLIYGGSNSPESRSREVYFSNIKLEKGDNETPFTSSPKDINAQQFPAQVAQDIYTAKEGNWNKAEKDYELLKVGKRNLLQGSKNGVSKDYWLSDKEKMKDYRQGVEYTEFIIDESVNTYGRQVSTSDDWYTKSLFIMVNKKCKFNVWTTGHRELKENTWERFDITRSRERFRLSFLDVQPDTVVRIKEMKIEVGKNSQSLPTPWTPAPQDINASPFTVKLAEDYYQQQSEITELRNAILQLGGK